MKRLTWRDSNGVPHWNQELLEDDSGKAGELIREKLATLEDIIGDCSFEELYTMIQHKSV